MVALLARGESVHINVDDVDMEHEARKCLERAGARGDIHFHHFPTNDAWCRDYAAVFLANDAADASQRLIAVDWHYNAWGGKYPPYDFDDEIAARMAETWKISCFQAGMVLEGGSIDVNGQGLLLTTESCLLNPNRNPDLSRADIQQRLIDYLGVERVLWLRGGIAGDDTDGHVDDVARFVGPNLVLAAVEEDPSDVNYQPLTENRALLAGMTSLDGRSLDVVELPMPPAVLWQGGRLPATYANFYIANEVVLVPGYDARRDEHAAGILQDLFPNREVIVIDCTDLVCGLGAFHCLTGQVPATAETPRAPFREKPRNHVDRA
jgi:agmatine deiminase